jgi:hypothetical protein
MALIAKNTLDRNTTAPGQATSTYRPCPACSAQKPADEPQYGATSAKLHQLQLISGFPAADIYRANFPPGLSDQDNERIRDATLVEALYAKGWIDT